MSASRVFTLMIFDPDRYFIDGVLRFLPTLYPQLKVRSSVGVHQHIDLLLTGRDALSLRASEQYAHLMTPESQLWVAHDLGQKPWRRLPSVWQNALVKPLHRGLPLEQLATLFQSLLPDKRQPVTVIDPRSAGDEVLTPREKAVLGHLRCDLTPDQIASSMSLHPKTISAHKRSVMHKLGMQRNLELYHWLFYSSSLEGERE